MVLSQNITYAYDPLGRQLSRTQAGVPVYRLNDGPRLLEEYNASGTVLATHVHGPRLDEVLSTHQGATQYFRLEDGLGSVTELLNGQGDLLERYTYDAFGLPTILAPDDTVRLTSSVGNRFLFTGREWDPLPELYHYRARYYEPWIGRFYQRDPFPGVVALPSSLHPYTYVLNNPVNLVDPYGLLSEQTRQNIELFLSNLGTGATVIAVATAITQFYPGPIIFGGIAVAAEGIRIGFFTSTPFQTTAREVLKAAIGEVAGDAGSLVTDEIIDQLFPIHEDNQCRY